MSDLAATKPCPGGVVNENLQTLAALTQPDGTPLIPGLRAGPCPLHPSIYDPEWDYFDPYWRDGAYGEDGASSCDCGFRGYTLAAPNDAFVVVLEWMVKHAGRVEFTPTKDGSPLIGSLFAATASALAERVR
jgi:hypothetical protein